MCKVMLHQTKNKHVMEDDRGTEYYFMPRHEGNDTDGKWMPGHLMGRRFVWDYRPGATSSKGSDGNWYFEDGRFYDKPRPYRMITGQVKRVRVTRYTFETFGKYENTPKGKNGQRYSKRALKYCNRCVYWDGERFWVAADIAICDAPRPDDVPCRKKFFNHTIKPFSGYLWDAWEKQSKEQGVPVVSIWCDDGVPYKVVMGDAEYPVAPSDVQKVAAWLKLRAA